MTKNVTFNEIANIRKRLQAPAPEPTCEADCEHIECSYVVACERHTAEQARLAATLTAPLLDALEQTLRDLGQAHDAQVPLELKCPQCDMIHVDQDEWATTRLHRKHLCHGCGHIWAPYAVTTVGVDVHASCRTRRDELLLTIRRLTETVPLDSEVAEALTQRGTLVAEVGTLRARIKDLETELANREGPHS